MQALIQLRVTGDQETHVSHLEPKKDKDLMHVNELGQPYLPSCGQAAPASL